VKAVLNSTTEYWNERNKRMAKNIGTQVLTADKT
jgi:hypothetical protein|tara:strand:- start:2732 stop:2833 length:102 start_codon:yes stop_codon:yes gene_type:complete